MDLRADWAPAPTRKRWVSILVIATIGSLLAMGYSLASGKTYTTTAPSFVAIGGSTDDAESAYVAFGSGGSSYSLQHVTTYVSDIGSPPYSRLSSKNSA